MENEKKGRAEKGKTAQKFWAELETRIDVRLKGIETGMAESWEQIVAIGRAVKGTESMLHSKLDRITNHAPRRTAVFIDGQNLDGVLRAFPGMRINFRKLLDLFNRYGDCLTVRAYYAEDVSDGDADREERIEKKRNFFRVLEGFGYYVYVKTKKLIRCNEGGVIGKANCDVEISHDMTILMDTRRFDAVILVSGDSDFAYLLQRMRDQGIYTTVIFTEVSLSSELRESCDQFVSLQSERIAKGILEDRPERPTFPDQPK